MRLTADERDMRDEIAYREDVQEQVDDAGAKRAASGLSPEELSIIDAYGEGCRAGTRGDAAGLNPYAEPQSPEYRAWEQGRSVAEASRLYRYLPKRAA